MGEYQTIDEGGIVQGVPWWVHGARCHVHPPTSIWPNSSAINTHIFGNHQERSWNNFSVTTSLCSSVIPSEGLFWYSTRQENHWGGNLHRPCYLHGDVWVVSTGPTGPYWLARWLSLCLWSSIQCSSRSSIRCNLILRCVC